MSFVRPQWTETGTGRARRSDGSTAKVELHVANSLWGQRGIAWESTFPDALARFYGAGMRLADYSDPEAARTRINAWTSAQTHGKIDHLIPEGVLTALTRLVLVNAVCLKAPWEFPFEEGRTGSPRSSGHPPAPAPWTSRFPSGRSGPPRRLTAP